MYVRSLVNESPNVHEGKIYEVWDFADGDVTPNPSPEGTMYVCDEESDCYPLYEDEYEIINENVPSLQSAIKLKTITTIEPQNIVIGGKNLHIDQGLLGVVIGLDHGVYGKEELKELARVFGELSEVVS